MAGSSSAAVGRRVRELRRVRGLSLSELARQAGVGKGSLSEIESGHRNPTLETLYALASPLRIPLTALVGEPARTRLAGNAATGPDVGAGTIITATSGMTALTLDVRGQPDGSVVEVFRLEFPAGADHESPAHAPGVREQLTVSSGRLRVGPVGRLRTVVAGQSWGWASDRPHRYLAPDGPAEAVVVIFTPAQD